MEARTRDSSLWSQTNGRGCGVETKQRVLQPREGTPQGTPRLLRSRPPGAGACRWAPGVGTRPTFQRRLRWQAEAPLGRLPSTCSARSVSCGACQGLLAPSWRLARPALHPAKTLAGTGAANWAARQEAAGAANRGSRCSAPTPRLACPHTDPELPWLPARHWEHPQKAARGLAHRHACRWQQSGE